MQNPPIYNPPINLAKTFWTDHAIWEVQIIFYEGLSPELSVQASSYAHGDVPDVEASKTYSKLP